MKVSKDATLNSETGGYEMDSKGSPIGVVRLEPNSSYCGVGKLLQGYINGSDSSAWEKIREKIDYTFEKLDLALAPLDRETGFGGEIRTRIGKGEKILFKPNLVSLFNIDPQTHGPDRGSTACTEWPFVAALMRWFHDRLLIRYREMALGEAATTMSAAAGFFSMLHPNRERITTEAAIEGKNGDFYCGWGFYFVRKYLKEALCTGSDEDPMQGYEESLAGHYIPPGFAAGRLMVYDLNRIADNPSKGRDLDVPDGAFFRTITLHKAIAGGNPQDDSDRKAYPGCILVNVPKLKVHNVTLFTNAIKNLGIGLYPMESSRAGRMPVGLQPPAGRPTGDQGGNPAPGVDCGDGWKGFSHKGPQWPLHREKNRGDNGGYARYHPSGPSPGDFHDPCRRCHRDDQSGPPRSGDRGQGAGRAHLFRTRSRCRRPFCSALPFQQRAAKGSGCVRARRRFRRGIPATRPTAHPGERTDRDPGRLRFTALSRPLPQDG